MFRTALRALLIASVLVTNAWAASQVGTWSPYSKHYGKTIAQVPARFYSVKVDSAGKVIAGEGSTITVVHQDTGAGCHTVMTVAPSFKTTGIGTVAPSPKHVYPNKCSFVESEATFKVNFPISANKAEEEAQLRKACENRPAGSSVIPVSFGFLTGFSIMLEYGTPGGGIDQLDYPQPQVTVMCETMALEDARVNPTSVGPSGGAIAISAKITSPVGTVGKVFAKVATTTATSNVPMTLTSGVWSATFNAPANVENTEVRYRVSFVATDAKGTTTTLTSATPLMFVVAAKVGFIPPVSPTAKPTTAPTLPH